jgi:hypothetical protein
MDASKVIAKLKFIYIETPPELDRDYKLLVEDVRIQEEKDSEVTTKKKRDQIREAFGGYGEEVLDWIYAQAPVVRSSMMNDLAMMRLISVSSGDDEARLMKLLTPSMRIYGFGTDEEKKGGSPP